MLRTVFPKMAVIFEPKIAGFKYLFNTLHQKCSNFKECIKSYVTESIYFYSANIKGS